MPNGAQDSYFESRILTADGIQLVQIMYQAAIDSTQAARECLRQGDIAGRSKAITKAYEIITELEVSLDHNVGGELSRNLLETYCYLRGRLLTANLEQSEPPLEEVVRLLRVLQEAWLQCKEIAPARQEQPGATDLDLNQAEPRAEVEVALGTGFSNGYAPATGYPPAHPPQEYHVSLSC